MAARWGVGEESLTTGNMEFFNTYTFVEGDLSGDGEGLALDDQLDPAGSLEPFHGCLDPSILSFFEDSVAIGEAKGRAEEESEATLLTALTEILDNVDDENLSPFDTLPDSELFSGQKGREQSPLRRFLNLARSPPGREPIRGPKSTPPVPGKLEGAGVERQQKARVLPWALDMALQRSDGEEEEEEEGGGDSTPCSEGPFSPDTTVEENTLALDSDGRCVSLSDLVKHMHPYCLAICLEPGEVEEEMQLLPEGAIVLEVVDQGEDGGTVLTIASALSLTEAGFLLQQEDKVEQEIYQEVGGSSSSKEESPHLNPALEERDDEEASEERPRGEAFGKCPTGRKKKRKSDEGGGGGCEERVLRGRTADRAEEGPSAPLETLPERSAQTMKKRVTFAPVLTSFLEGPVDSSCSGEKTVVPALRDQKLADQLLAGVDMEPCKKASIHNGEPVSQQGEPKPRPLSLQQYWLLRQQKKPAPVEKQEDQSTKWPSLPEPPTELLPIPCLVKPQPPQDQSAFKTTPVTEPAWHPVGNDAPPTPQALLIPLESVGTSGKATGASAKPVSVPKAAEGSQDRKPPCEPAALHPLVSRVMNPRQQPSSPTALVSQSTIGTTPQPNVLNTNHQARCVLLARATAQTPKPQSIPTAVKKGTPSQQMVSGSTTRERPQRVAQKRLTLVQMPSLAKRNPRVSQDLTNEIGIEATDLTSLLEQFEETQAKEEKRVPEVCGRAAAVGSSSLEQQPARKPLERPRGPDLGTAGLTPPATPPHQVWKPLTPITLLGKAKQPEGTKPSPSKTLQGTTPQLVPRNRAGCGSPTTVAYSLPQKPLASKEPLAFADHDYCLPSGQPLDPQRYRFHSERQHGAVKLAARTSPSTKTQYVATATQSSTTYTPPKFISQPLDHRTLTGSVLLSPDSSPCRPEADSDATSALGVERPKDQSRGTLRFSEHPASPPGRERGRTRRRYRARSSSSESSCSGSSSESSSGSRSSSSSGSRSRSDSSSPPRKRFCSRRSESGSSCSSSRSHSRSPPPRRRYSYSSSCSRSWSRSRSRSWSPREPRHQWWRGNCSPSYTRRYRYDSRERFQCQDVKERKEKAIEERRVVYVGRIRGGMTRKELKERFSQYGEIEECTLHFRDYGDNYGFVTYYNTKDAFNAIENGSKLRQSDELPFDLCFGGRRQFCKSNYADLDSNREYELVPTKSKYDALDFDTLLKQAQKGLKR